LAFDEFLSVVELHSIHRVKWRHSNVWSRYDLRRVRHDGVLCDVNWWRFVTVFK